ncbi:MAG TPA: single-stranded-DNA-specific exonuclease RecJ, partial [Myxococcota bacterium]|nr:single-stranded-DNA-specific exonuclease RecJ [Myxococcota bacterium]
MNDPRSWTGARWVLLSADDRQVEALRRDGFAEAVARCMVIRDLGASALQRAPELDQLHDPYAMRGMDEAVDRFRRAIRDRERVRILTDYDVDGTTSSLILQATLRLAAPDLAIDYHIPDRFTEGYGFSVEAAEKAGRDGVHLLVTADIGVRDHASVARAREAGVDVIICDHHLPAGMNVPAGAIVLCPPQEGCPYPNRSLAACGVSLKLAQALLADHPRRDRVLRSLLKLAAIGTVADLVPLSTPENRAIVSLGLEALNTGPHNPGLAALLDVCRLAPGGITEADLAFRVAPRINAAGRIASAMRVVDLLTTSDAARARALAEELEALNLERRAVQHQLVDRALEAAAAATGPFVVVAGAEEDGWHRGVVGIVAARLKDELHRPVAVVSIQGDLAVGSVRSVPGVHAVQALESASDLLVRFGGHPAAAGFSLPASRLPELRDRLTAWMLAHTAEDTLVPERAIDAVVPAEALDARLHGELLRMSPFGMGNPEPRLLVR